MVERPILFNSAMVRAILGGTKTQTRRVVKGAALEWLEPWMFAPEFVAASENAMCPFGHSGDRLWVRETWACLDSHTRPGSRLAYRANTPDGERVRVDAPWRPSIYMPRWASRITLEITGVRVERLQAISEADAQAEGCTQNHNGYFWGGPHAEYGRKQMPTAKAAFADLWDSINGPGSWDANPWVWCVEFRRLEAAS